MPLGIDRDGCRPPLRGDEPGQYLFRQRHSSWPLILPVHQPPSTRHRGHDLVSSFQVGEVLVVRYRTQGAALGIDDRAVPVAWSQPSTRTMRPISVSVPLKIAVQPV